MTAEQVTVKPTRDGLYLVSTSSSQAPYKVARWEHDHWRTVGDRIDDDNRIPEGRIETWMGPLVPAGQPTPPAEPLAEGVELPDSPGYWFCQRVVPFAPRDEAWQLVRVFRPLWVDPARTDLRWKYLDGSGGDDERYDFKPGQKWAKAIPAVHPAPSPSEAERLMGEPCTLMHTCCGSCGCAIDEDGGCNCPDNRPHGVARLERDLRSQYLLEIARLRKCETQQIPTIEEAELADTKILRVRLFHEVADLRQQLATAQAELAANEQSYHDVCDALTEVASERDAAREEAKGLRELLANALPLLPTDWPIHSQIVAALAAKGGA